MLQKQSGVGTNYGGDSEEDEKKRCLSTEIVHKKFKGSNSRPFVVGDLEVLKLGNIFILNK